MADGGRAGRRKERFTDAEAEQVDRAAKRLARAFGYGNAWRMPTWELADGGRDAGMYAGSLTIAHRGKVVEQAVWRLGSKTHVRRQHDWVKHGRVVAVPSVQPDPAGQAALSYARLAKPLEHLLRAYALESIADWYAVEPFLHAIRPSRHAVMAGRDAMARIMYAEAATAIDTRARQLCMRAPVYREETRGAEYQLRAWLVMAATAYNDVGNVYFARVYPSQGNGFRQSTCWDESQRTYFPNAWKQRRTAGRIPTLPTA